MSETNKTIAVCGCYAARYFGFGDHPVAARGGASLDIQDNEFFSLPGR